MSFSKRTACIILSAAYWLLLPTAAFSADEPFTSPSNWGGTGLMEIPTARVMREDTYRAGFTQVRPYRYFYGAISPLRGLEIDGRITEVLDVPALTESYGNFKDKAIDLKYQFYPEGKYMPAIAIGIMDPHGTRVYPSQYIVASKQIYPFDLTIGVGNGRFGERPLPDRSDKMKVEMFTDTADWIRDSQFFWGIQFVPSPKYALMLEYSPVRYHIQSPDPAVQKYFRDPVPSKFNFGLRFYPADWAEIGISYQRGNEFGFTVSTAFDIGEPLLPLYDPVYRQRQADRLHPLHSRLAEAVASSGFSNVGITVEGNELWIEARNDKYYFNTRAIGVILDIAAAIVPEDVHRIHIILKEREVPLVEFTANREDLVDLDTGKMTMREFLRLSEYDTGVTELHATSVLNKRPYDYGIRPSLETFLNDPSGFFRYRFGVSGWMNYYPWQGTALVLGLATYPLNNITTTNEPLSIPVRTDMVPYKEEKVVLNRLMVDSTRKFPHEIYAKVAAGILETQYAGIDAECAVPLFDGRVIMGVGGSAVKKRDPDNMLKIRAGEVKDVYSTAFLNARLNIPETDMALDVKAGRFLAGDNGVRITVSKFIKGVVIWTWYSFTDTSIFSDEFNRGYNDKGIGVSIPLRLFTGTDTKTSYNYVLSPWTRDTGQDIEHFSPLVDFIGRNTKFHLDKDRGKMY